ncbi:retrovirus-related pol polyprotein from transposon TNT 1-94 [Tanacetum coccineum]
MVNILGEPHAGVTIRSRIRDSEAASAHECFYVNFLFEIEPKKLIEALEGEGLIISMQEELNQFGKKNSLDSEQSKTGCLGYNQHEGIDYDETFARVARLEAIRIFLAYAAYIGFVVFQMDVKSAFTNEKISEEVYVQQTPGFESSEFPNHVLQVCQRYQANPKESHLVAVKRIFKYLKRTPNIGLWFPKGSGFDLKAYFNSDYAGYNLDRKSTSGGCQILDGKLVCWIAKNQSLVAMSSAEAEYVATTGCSDLQLADIFTKPLAEPSFTRLVAELGMLNIEKEVSDKKNTINDALTKILNVFKCKEGIIAYNNAVALLEHPNILYHPIRSFLSNRCITTALTIQPSAICVEYLKEFWYTTKVDDATKKITFSLSTFDKLLSFTHDFIFVIGLNYSESYVLLPEKEIVRAGLATLGLVDEDKPSLSSTALVKSSPLKMKYFLPIWRIFMQYIVKCLAASFKKPLAFEVALTSHMLKAAKVLNEPEKSLILPFEEVNADDTADKFLSGTNVTVDTADVTQILVASESAEEQGNQLKTAEAEKTLSLHTKSDTTEDNVEEEVKSSRLTTMGDITFDKLMDEYEKKKGVAKVEYESPYDTESVIKFVKSFPVSIIFGSLFIDQDMMGDTTNLSLQDQLVEEEVDSDLKLMPDDEVKSFSGFEAAESINE